MARERRARLLAVVDRFTGEDLNKGIRPPVEGFQEMPAREFFLLWALHHLGHLQDMLEALPERRETPFVREWLAKAGAT